jgi:pilus assembly protein CpaB
MKKIFPLIGAVVVFLIALILARPAPSRMVVVAATDLRAGHTLQDSDLTMMSVPNSVLAPDVITDKSMLVGQLLRIDRGQGDVIRASQIGNLIKVAANERAIAVHVTDYTGVAALLVPGQSVGVVASIPQQDGQQQDGVFSKATIEGLRVLYIDPNFAANMDANTVSRPTPAAGGTGAISSMNASQDRAQEGSVLLAVPVDLQTIFYDFTSQNVVSQTRSVNALELLSALGSTPGASLTLYLMPDVPANKFTSPGLWLPNLVITNSATFTPTPTLPAGAIIQVTPTP